MIETHMLDKHMLSNFAIKFSFENTNRKENLSCKNFGFSRLSTFSRNYLVELSMKLTKI